MQLLIWCRGVHRCCERWQHPCGVGKQWGVHRLARAAFFVEVLGQVGFFDEVAELETRG